MVQPTPERIIRTYDCSVWSYLFRKLSPLLSFFSTEGKAAFRVCPKACPWWRTADEIGYITTLSDSSSQDCYFSRYRISLPYPNYRVRFCFHSSKPGCEIYCCLLQVLPAEDGEANRSAGAAVRNSRRYLRYKTTLSTKRTLVWKQHPRHTPHAKWKQDD